MPFEPSDRIVLEKLFDLVPERDKKRRKLLTNLDKLAQAALDAERTYSNKHGEISSIPQPDFNAAIKAMESAKALLGLETAPVEKVESQPVARILAAVPKGTGG